MSKRYKIGVIGTGGRATAFAPQLQEGWSRAELHSLCDVDGDRLARFVAEGNYAGVPAFTDVEAFMNQKDMDAVVATVPDFVHRDVTIQAMKAGKPIYLEKPIANTLSDAYDMLEAHEKYGVLVYLGFNLRAAIAYNKLREVVKSGVLGQIIHIAGVEQLHVAHIASFMRRFHRHSALNGGLLNAKCSHDLDIMRWLIGLEHHVVRISSFGGCNVFLPSKQPATHCHLCPGEVYDACPYKAPDKGKGSATSSRTPDLYPGDLCVYTPDKDIVDNQTLIMEWDHGVRGSFELQGFQHQGTRMTRIWGEKAVLDFDGSREPHVRVTHSGTGDTDEYHFAIRQGGHGGVDNLMIDRFLDAIERGGAGDSGLAEGLAATILAIKADESRLTGKTMDIPREMYSKRPAPLRS